MKAKNLLFNVRRSRKIIKLKQMQTLYQHPDQNLKDLKVCEQCMDEYRNFEGISQTY